MNELGPVKVGALRPVCLRFSQASSCFVFHDSTHPIFLWNIGQIFKVNELPDGAAVTALFLFPRLGAPWVSMAKCPKSC